MAVCLLHSYANPKHEVAVGEELKRQFPGAEVTLSSSLVPEIREYERSSTAIVNAYVQPLVSRYLRDMEHELKSLGMTGPLRLMLSSGGLASGRRSGRRAGEPDRVWDRPAARSPPAIFGDMTGTTT